MNGPYIPVSNLILSIFLNPFLSFMLFERGPHIAQDILNPVCSGNSCCHLQCWADRYVTPCPIFPMFPLNGHSTFPVIFSYARTSSPQCCSKPQRVRGSVLSVCVQFGHKCTSPVHKCVDVTFDGLPDQWPT